MMTQAPSIPKTREFVQLKPSEPLLIASTSTRETLAKRVIATALAPEVSVDTLNLKSDSYSVAISQRKSWKDSQEPSVPLMLRPPETRPVRYPK
jgi:hypothetical protein